MPGGTAPGETPSSARPGHCLSAYMKQIAHKQPPQAQVRAPAEASSGLSSACSCGAQAPLALVLPRVPAPQLPLTDTLGRSICLPARLRGKVTAVQLMFAGCSSTCPIQGAVYAAVAQKVKAPDVRLLSFTVDPLDDTPQSLHTWLVALVTLALDVRLATRAGCRCPSESLRGISPKTGTHSSQVFLFDRQAKLTFRTIELPSAEHVAELLAMLAAA